MKKEKRDGRQLAMDFFLDLGFRPDRYGNLKKTTGKGKVYRVKFNPNKLRYEIKIVHGSGDSSWVRIASGYYSKLSIDSKTGKLLGLSRRY